MKFPFFLGENLSHKTQKIAHPQNCRQFATWHLWHLSKFETGYIWYWVSKNLCSNPLNLHILFEEMNPTLKN